MTENLSPRDQLARALCPPWWETDPEAWQDFLRKQADRAFAHLRSDESVERVARLLSRNDFGPDEWADESPQYQDFYRYSARAAIDALLGGEGS